jgi:hypothetical protein
MKIKLYAIFLWVLFLLFAALSLTLWLSQDSNCDSDQQNLITQCAQGIFGTSLIYLILGCVYQFVDSADNSMYFHAVLSLNSLTTLILAIIIYSEYKSCDSSSVYTTLSLVVIFSSLISFSVASAATYYVYKLGNSMCSTLKIEQLETLIKNKKSQLQQAKAA